MKEIINTTLAPTPIGPYSQAVKAGNTLYISGQIATDPTTNELVMDTIENETRQVLKNFGNVLKAAGYDFSNVVKVTIFLSDMAHFATVNAIYGESFQSDAPARETVAVKTLPKNVNVEISAIAYKE